MAKMPTLTSIVNGFLSASKLNENFNRIRTAFQNTLSRDGSGPNEMHADLDMNGFRILNASTDFTTGGGGGTIPAGYLIATNNLSDVPNKSLARANLGIIEGGPSGGGPDATALKKTANLSDLTSPSTARLNLGVLDKSLNFSDVPDKTNAVINLGALNKNNNLNDVQDKPTARFNLGVLATALNLSDVPNKALALQNLGFPAKPWAANNLFAVGSDGNSIVFKDPSGSVTFGTTAGTAAQGNDSRITGALQKAMDLGDLSNKTNAFSNLTQTTPSAVVDKYYTSSGTGYYWKDLPSGGGGGGTSGAGNASDINNFKQPGDPDWTLAFQRAFTAKHAVYVPNGTYNVTTIDLPISGAQDVDGITRGPTLIGESHTGTIIQGTVANQPVITLSQGTNFFTIKNLTIRHTGTAVAGGDGIYHKPVTVGGVFYRNSDNGIIADCYVEKNWHGLNLGMTGYSTIERCYLNENKKCGFVATATDGVAMQWYVFNCLAGKNGEDGFSWRTDGFNAGGSSMGALTDCATFDNGRFGVAALGNADNAVQSLRVQGGFYGGAHVHEFYLDSYGVDNFICPGFIELALECGICISANNWRTTVHVEHLNNCGYDGIYNAGHVTQITGGMITANGNRKVEGRRNGVYHAGGSLTMTGVTCIDVNTNTQPGGGTANNQSYGLYIGADSVQVTGCDLRYNYVAPLGGLPAGGESQILASMPPSINTSVPGTPPSYTPPAGPERLMSDKLRDTPHIYDLIAPGNRNSSYDATAELQSALNTGQRYRLPKAIISFSGTLTVPAGTNGAGFIGEGSQTILQHTSATGNLMVVGNGTGSVYTHGFQLSDLTLTATVAKAADTCAIRAGNLKAAVLTNVNFGRPDDQNTRNLRHGFECNNFVGIQFNGGSAYGCAGEAYRFLSSNLAAAEVTMDGGIVIAGGTVGIHLGGGVGGFYGGQVSIFAAGRGVLIDDTLVAEENHELFFSDLFTADTCYAGAAMEVNQTTGGTTKLQLNNTWLTSSGKGPGAGNPNPHGLWVKSCPGGHIQANVQCFNNAGDGVRLDTTDCLVFLSGMFDLNTNWAINPTVNMGETLELGDCKFIANGGTFNRANTAEQIGPRKYRFTGTVNSSGRLTLPHNIAGAKARLVSCIGQAQIGTGQVYPLVFEYIDGTNISVLSSNPAGIHDIPGCIIAEFSRGPSYGFA